VNFLDLARQAAAALDKTRPAMSATACLACNTIARVWVPDWPIPGEGRWLCQTCIGRDHRMPQERLRAAYGGLTPAERERLWAEADGGDHLAGLILTAVEEFPEAEAKKGAPRMVSGYPPGDGGSRPDGLLESAASTERGRRA